MEKEYKGKERGYKMSRVILFKPGDICHNSLGYWMDLLSELFQKRGVETVIFPNGDEPEILKQKMEKVLSEKKTDAAMMFNANAGFVLFRELFEKHKVPFFNYIVDHPLDHNLALQNAFGQYNVICLDRNHKEFIERYFPKVQNTYFLPLAGMMDEKGDETYDEFRKRPYDITFTGNLSNTDEMIAILAKYPEESKKICLGWIEKMLLHINLSPEDALRVLLHEWGVDKNLSDEQFLQLGISFKQAIFFVRNYIREEVVTKLLEEHIPIHIFGSGWDRIKEKFPESKELFHGDIDIDETMAVNRQSKIVLNILPWFKAGTHDRIETAQLNGAAVLSDDNPYLREIYRDNEQIYFYQSSNTDALPGQIKAILSDPEQLYHTMLEGKKLAKESMTWDVLADKLLEILT